MDLSSNRRRLTPEERQRRIAEGRCRYCKGLGYIAAICPVAPRPLRAVQGLVAPTTPAFPGPVVETPAPAESLN